MYFLPGRQFHVPNVFRICRQRYLQVELLQYWSEFFLCKWCSLRRKGRTAKLSGKSHFIKLNSAQNWNANSSIDNGSFQEAFTQLSWTISCSPLFLSLWLCMNLLPCAGRSECLGIHSGLTLHMRGGSKRSTIWGTFSYSPVVLLLTRGWCC